MTVARQLLATTLALVVTFFPLALERCRTACVNAAGSAQPSAPPSHACHEMAGREDGPTVSPVPQACGHNEQERGSAFVAVSATKVRMALPAAFAPLPVSVVDVSVASQEAVSPGRLRAPPAPAVARDLPLRV